jgi:hypothetical protein
MQSGAIASLAQLLRDIRRNPEAYKMRPQFFAGLVLTILGIVALSIRSFTYFSHEQVVGPLGFFAWDISQPHTILINPIAGIVALAIGLYLVVSGRGSMRA